MSVGTYEVAGMSCEHCVNAIKGEVVKITTVKSVDVDLNSKKVVVVGDNFSDLEIISAIDEAGYDAVRLN